jgi:amino acid adenylation domain-containing protein
MATSNLANLRADPVTEPLAKRSERDCGSVKPGQHLDLPPEQRMIRDRCLHASGSFIEFPCADVEISVAARFEKIAQRYPGQVAVQMDERSVTYAEIDALANRIGREIIARPGPTSEPIGLLFDKGIEQFGAMLGVLKAGRFFVSLEPSLTKARLDFTLAECRPQLVITDRSHQSLADRLIEDRRQALLVETVSDDDRKMDISSRISPDDYACITFTSGSTGRPKGIIWSQRTLLHHVMLRTNADGLCAEDRLAHLTAGTSNATTNVFFALLSGAALLAYATESRSMNELWAWLARERITVCMIAAPLFRSLCAAPEKRERLDDLRLIRLRSDTALVGDVELFKQNFADRCVLANGLASSETGMLSEYYIGHETALDDNGVPVGYAAEDKEMFVVDDDGHRLDPEEIGELVVRSRYLSPGYWRDPELTGAKFKADPADPRMRLYHTADLALMRRDGCLFHKGRKDFRVKIRGYGVDIVEVERTLRTCRDIRQAIVVARPDQAGETRLIAYITTNDPAGPDVGELRAFMREKLDDYMVPSAFVRLETIPLTANGKIDRKALPDPDTARPQLAAPYVKPRNEFETQLAQIWAKVLSRDGIGIHDNFFDLGGQSLASIRLISEIEKRYGRQISVTMLLHSPTIAQLAGILAEHRNAAPSPLVPIQTAGSKPPLFLAHGTDSYSGLVRYLDGDQPLYGLAQHLEGRKVRHTSIEAIAAYYVEEIRRIQPVGPYYIGGHSIGGLIALEMAQQLQKGDQEVALLAVLDSGAPTKIEASDVCLARPESSRKNLSEKLESARLEKKLWSMRQRLQERLRRGTKATACGMYQRLGMPMPPRLKTFYVDEVVYGQIYPDAHRRYEPRTYSGRAVYFKSEDARERVAGWQKLMTRGLEVRPVTGNHLTMLVEPHVKGLAEALRQCLREAPQPAILQRASCNTASSSFDQIRTAS